MNRNIDKHEGLQQKIKAFRSAFSNSNMVRMREALRYMSGPKLNLFIHIPFYIHANLPEFPGFIPKGPPAHGIQNFMESGFYKTGLAQGISPEAGQAPENPCVLGLYHIGSLGTFTQSSGSDFDYWVIIDKKNFSEQRHYNFQKKLDHIVRYARADFDQEVTFFIMDLAEIKRDCYTGLDDQETLAAPKLFLKEEFYRTFLYIAGKIPLWTILPPKGDDDAYEVFIEKLCAYENPTPINKDFLDLGKISSPEKPDILRGILWHICKARFDPVKALIKATMIFSHEYGSPDQSGLLCNEIRAGYSDAGIDDYRADPYKTLFDRVIAFHEAKARESLNLIKNAIFLRLCGYPNVKLPDPGAPKKQLLDRYIRAWNLSPSQVKKILSFGKWAEGEKLLLEKALVNRLSQMYEQISKDIDPKDLALDKTEARNLAILMNKAKERLNPAKDKIQACSTFLKAEPFQFFLFRRAKYQGWKLWAYRPDDSQERLIHKSPTFLGLVGWILENNICRLSTDTMKLDTESHLFESADRPVNPEAILLALQPVSPLSDNVFEFDPQWKKLIVLLKKSHGKVRSAGVSEVELLSLNTWGELFTDQLELDTKDNLIDRYRKIALKINQYKGENLRLFFFQLTEEKERDAVFQISHFLDRRFLNPGPLENKRNRPLLDKL